MSKVSSLIAGVAGGCLLATTTYLVMSQKKNMLDVLIEEIETKK